VAGEGTRLFDRVPKSYSDLVSSTARVAGPSSCSTDGTANPGARQLTAKTAYV